MARNQQISVMKLSREIQSEGDAYTYLEGLRWNGTPVCPHCESERVYFLNPANGVNRKTRTGAKSERRVWKCGACRKQFSVLTGTIFHGTKISVHTWLMVIFEMCASKNGVSAREIERKYELTAKTAWFMAHRIREAMKRDSLVGMLSGTVVADEAWIGGSDSNRHKSRRHPGITRATEPTRIVPGQREARSLGPVNGKTSVFSLIDTATGEPAQRWFVT